MKKVNQREIVLNHFKRFKSINQQDAIEMYGIYRLSAVIYDLKHKDNCVFSDEMIKVDNRYGSKSRVKSYTLINKGENK